MKNIRKGLKVIFQFFIILIDYLHIQKQNNTAA